jgi:hypothetical protein
MRCWQLRDGESLVRKPARATREERPRADLGLQGSEEGVHPVPGEKGVGQGPVVPGLFRSAGLEERPCLVLASLGQGVADRAHVVELVRGQQRQDIRLGLSDLRDRRALALAPDERPVCLRDRFDEARHPVTEALGDLLTRHLGVLDRVVEQPGGDELVVIAVPLEDPADADRMDHVRKAGALPRVLDATVSVDRERKRIEEHLPRNAR